MKKPNITPGPWNVVHRGRSIYIETDSVFIADLQAKGAADLETAENDAKIIAAAPAMAEALEAMLQSYAPFHQESVDHKGGEDGLHSAVRAARNALKSAGYEF